MAYQQFGNSAETSKGTTSDSDELELRHGMLERNEASLTNRIHKAGARQRSARSPCQRTSRGPASLQAASLFEGFGMFRGLELGKHRRLYVG